MASPYSTLFTTAVPTYLHSLDCQLPFVLVEAMASLTSSFHLRYSTNASPSSPRSPSMSREAMLSQPVIFLELKFTFDPRELTQREQFTLESAALLTREAFKERVDKFDTGSSGDVFAQFAQLQASDALRQRERKFTSFLTVSAVKLAPELCRRNEQALGMTRMYKATMRPDALINPAEGSEDWFQFLKKKLGSPECFYERLGEGEVYEVTRKERETAYTEAVRRTAVETLDYPPAKAFDLQDETIELLMRIIIAGTRERTKGSSRHVY
ncbi:hypothetical protein P7C70_g3776, partial [Phenoliferia sp. Uapishka_3]